MGFSNQKAKIARISDESSSESSDESSHDSDGSNAGGDYKEEEFDSFQWSEIDIAHVTDRIMKASRNWTEGKVKLFVEGLITHHWYGHWRRISKMIGTRTNVNVKDKWKTCVDQKIARYEEKNGISYPCALNEDGSVFKYFCEKTP